MSKSPIVTGEIYHVYSKSIAGYKIFNNDAEFSRIEEVVAYYQTEKRPIKFSKFKERNMQNKKEEEIKKLVQIICYCFMPTHIHLVLKQLKDKGVSKFVNNILNSYSHYFNIKHNRKGPLWEGRFKNVLIDTDEQFLHLTRYIHLNPVTEYLVDKPEDWKYSSYREYIGLVEKDKSICDFSDYFNMDLSSYRRFVNDRVDYQRQLAKIKHLMFVPPLSRRRSGTGLQVKAR